MGGQKALSGAPFLLHPASSLLPGCFGQHQRRRRRSGFDGGRGNAEFFGGFGLGAAAKAKRVNYFALPGLEVQGQLAHADVLGDERGGRRCRMSPGRLQRRVAAVKPVAGAPRRIHVNKRPRAAS